MSLVSKIYTDLKVRLFGARLDRELALGAAPDSNPLLRARAGQLEHAVRRRRLAFRLEAILDAVESSGRGEGTGRIFDREEIVRALPLLVKLVDRLRESGPSNPQGVAVVAWLVSDTRSPVFVQSQGTTYDPNAESLAIWAEEALHRLDGSGAPR